VLHLLLHPRAWIKQTPKTCKLGCHAIAAAEYSNNGCVFRLRECSAIVRGAGVEILGVGPPLDQGWELRMGQWRRAIPLAAGAAAILGVGIFLLRPSSPGPTLPPSHERARVSHRVQLRLDQLRVDRPGWRGTGGRMPLQVSPPAAPQGGRRGIAALPGGTHAAPYDTRHSAPGAAADPEVAGEEDKLLAMKKIALEDPDPDRRLAAIAMLSTTDDPEALAVLAQALSDPNEEVRMAALEALSDFTHEPPVDAIEDALRDPSPDIRFEALSVLADVGGERARSAIEQALSDPDADVRALAQGILDLEGLPEPTPEYGQPPR
jgi:hypothetical protein